MKRSTTEEIGFMLRNRSVRIVAAFSALLIAVVWTSIAAQLRIERENAVERAMQRTSGLARVFEEHVLRTLRSVDLTLRHIESDYRAHGKRLDLAAFAQGHRMALDPYNLLSVTDERGNLVLASEPFEPQNYASRDNFRFHAAHDSDALAVSKPQLGTVTGRPSMYISRRFNRPDGSFGGVLAVAVDPDYFSSFYDQIDLGRDGVVVLVGTDGIVRARRSSRDVAVGQDLSGYDGFRAMGAAPAGSYVAQRGIDGVQRLFSYRRIPHYPLIVQVGVGERETLAPYLRLRTQFVAWAGAVTAIVLLFAGLVAAQSLRQLRTGRALQESEARLRAILDAEPECVELVDRNCRVLDINRSGLEMAEVDDLAALPQRSMLPLVAASYRDAVQDVAAKVFAGQRAQLIFELAGARGTRRWIDMICAPLADARHDARVGAMLVVARDITAQKRMQDELVASRKLLQDILDAIYAFVGLFDLEGRLVESNRAPVVRAGLTREDVIGVPFWETYWWGHSAAVQARLKQAMLRAARGETVRYDEVARLRDETYVNIDIQFGPVRDPAGLVTQVVGFGVDITERRRAEAERMHLAYIVQTSHDAIISRSIDHRILSWNAGAERLFGYAAEEVLGREVSLIIAPECLRRYNERREQSSSGRVAGQHETVCVAKDGSRIDVAVSSSLVKNEMGELVAVSIILRDITEQKRSEAQQRLAASVLESAAEGVVITDIAQNVVSMNHAFTQITGFERADAASRNPRLLACAAHPGSSYEEIWATVRRDGHWRGEVWDRRKNGELYCALLSINAVRNEQGDVVNYCALLMDVTQRKSAEAKLTRLNAELEDRVAARTRQLESANKELAAFSYSVSHDLRAPLRAVAGFSALVLAKSRDVTDPETRNRLQRIHANAERMGVLIDDLLRLSRVSQRELDRRRFDLSALAAEALANLRRMEPGRVVDASVQPGMMADGDPMLVRLVLDNLIGNAWKFTGRTSRPRITVTAHEEDGNGAYCVSDNGAGFDMQYAGKLFNAFQRLHRSDEFDGTGIGLSIVHRVVAKHGGKVWADAAVGRGARFYFTLG